MSSGQFRYFKIGSDQIQVSENQIRSGSGHEKKPEPDLKKSGNHFQVQVKGTLTCSEPNRFLISFFLSREYLEKYER